MFKMFIISTVILLSLAIFSFFIFSKPERSSASEDPIPTVASEPPLESEPEIKDIHSPDGSMNVRIEKVILGDNVTYSFYVSELTEGTPELIFEKNLPKNVSMDVPANSWSPDNIYFFIKESSSGYTDYFVFNANGEPFLNESEFISVGPIFQAAETGYSIQDVTGWASYNLLMILTTDENDVEGPSFWFEVPSTAVIRLYD